MGYFHAVPAGLNSEVRSLTIGNVPVRFRSSARPAAATGKVPPDTLSAKLMQAPRPSPQFLLLHGDGQRYEPKLPLRSASPDP
jgi:hypothetical protein